VSLKSKDGKNIFAVAASDKESGRKDAQYTDTKWLSQEGEWFLAGVLDGLEDIVPMVSTSEVFIIVASSSRLSACSNYQRV